MVRNKMLWEKAGKEPIKIQILRRKWRWIGHTLRVRLQETRQEVIQLRSLISFKLGTNVRFGEWKIVAQIYITNYFIPFKLGGPSEKKAI